MSLISPQLEDGHLKIANSIAEALAHTQLSGHESRVLWFLFRKTYGWSKKADVISLSQWMEGTGLSKSHVVDTLNRLVVRRIIRKAVPEIRNKKSQEYWFNKHANEWKSFPKTGTFPKSGIISFPKSGHTTTRKNTTTKGPSLNSFKIESQKPKTQTLEEKTWAGISSGTYDPHKDRYHQETFNPDEDKEEER